MFDCFFTNLIKFHSFKPVVQNLFFKLVVQKLCSQMSPQAATGPSFFDRHHHLMVIVTTIIIIVIIIIIVTTVIII